LGEWIQKDNRNLRSSAGTFFLTLLWTLPKVNFELNILDQLCIVCVVNKDKKNLEDNLDNNTWNKNTNVQIFRIFDGLINIFPGLSNVFRRGVERDKIVNLYSRITFKELKDSAFEIPTIGIQ